MNSCNNVTGGTISVYAELDPLEKAVSMSANVSVINVSVELGRGISFNG
jgi:hypothetical protein